MRMHCYEGWWWMVTMVGERLKCGADKLGVRNAAPNRPFTISPFGIGSDFEDPARTSGIAV
jgi:hypothetical protein